jgi:hypothetical protein
MPGSVGARRPALQVIDLSVGFGYRSRSTGHQDP